MHQWLGNAGQARSKMDRKGKKRQKKKAKKDQKRPEKDKQAVFRFP